MILIVVINEKVILESYNHSQDTHTHTYTRHGLMVRFVLVTQRLQVRVSVPAGIVGRGSE